MPSRCAQTSVEVGVEVILLTEFVCEGDASEQFAPFTLDWVDIEEHNKAWKETNKHQQEDDNLTAFAVQVHAAKTDVGQEGEGQEEARDEATNVGKIVNPGQEPKGKKEEHHTQQLGESPPGLGQDLPALKQLHKQTGQDPKLRACRTHLKTDKRHTYTVEKTHQSSDTVVARSHEEKSLAHKIYKVL